MRLVTLRNATAPVVAVNDVVIGNAAIAREVQNHAGADARQGWHEATRALVVRELLAQRARALGLTAVPQSVDGCRETEEEALIRALLEAEVRTPRADEEVCRRYYLTNPARFRSPDLFEPVHILFQAAREDEAAFARALERARAVLDEVLADPGRFGALARALSDCPSASEGGRLGQVTRGETTPEFEAALVSLDENETWPEPVRTRYGVHVLRLERKVAGHVLPFEQVRGRIARYLEESSWRRAVAQYVALLAGQAKIDGFDLPGATTPLVQ
ncbi:peptidyl-prolyl cis-trans isomerase C [Roseomonas rosea]|uniref:Parvulin-like PPIase n=1 Tax=Muricoccus roseus TaxID=198092 RepID=A0A1M6N4M4_9PROT|nr:peptidylprolyl isomerase [Roseomonas rosea]SHJ90602.1 peptidyl-prolyl cis-trans isomerase C [Roseomonas rosea]